MSAELVEFHAPELLADGSFQVSRHAFVRDASGWSVFREGIRQVHLGEGFELVQPRFCGVCATDLARTHLPFPLPQIVGHEVLALRERQPVVVEINASHLARGLDPAGCMRCRDGLETHCADRVTLGINRLPGGFAPYMLAPVRGIVPVPEQLSPMTAAFAEPFAAALHAVEITPPVDGAEVAVLGPRRLGLLLIAALDRFRKKTGRRFGVTAVLRHPRLSELCAELGANHVLDVSDGVDPAWQAAFDTVFDTSGTPEGLSLSLVLASRRVHLKSTHGRSAGGLLRLTDMVVDEISLLPYEASRLVRQEPLRSGPVGDLPAVYHSPSVAEAVKDQLANLASIRRIGDTGSAAKACTEMMNEVDVAVVSSLKEVDDLLGPEASRHSPVRVRPRGRILWAGPVQADIQTPVGLALRRGIEVHTSRCGSLQLAVEILASDPKLARVLEARFNTHIFPLAEIGRAFQVAGDSRASIKVTVDMGL